MVQPGEMAGMTEKVDQMQCAQNIPERVFEAARVARFAWPEKSREEVADRVASYYGYTDPEARRVFLRAVESHLYSQA